MSKSKKIKGKFTEEEISRSLSHAHELINGGQLRQGMKCDEVGCLLQASLNEGSTDDVFNVTRKKLGSDSLIWRFDDFFVQNGRGCTPDQLLRFLEKEGVA